MNLLKRIFTRTNRAADATSIAWVTYEYLDGTDKGLVERAFGGDIDIEKLSNLLSRMYARSYLLELAAERWECPASDCENYRGYIVAGLR